MDNSKAEKERKKFGKRQLFLFPRETVDNVLGAIHSSGTNELTAVLKYIIRSISSDIITLFPSDYAFSSLKDIFLPRYDLPSSSVIGCREEEEGASIK